MRQVPSLYFGKTGLISTHSVGLLHDTLITEDCELCDDFRPYLFLPTATRCCLRCLRFRPIFRLITPREANICFGLIPKNLFGIPVLHILKGGERDVYQRQDGSCRRQTGAKLLTVEHCETRARQKYGSKEAMQTLVTETYAKKLSEYEDRVSKGWAKPFMSLPSKVAQLKTDIVAFLFI